jgi:hypothetical protein
MNSHQRRKIKRHSSGPTATTTAIPQVHIPAIEGVLPKPPEKPPEKPPLRRTVSAGKAFLSTLLAVATLIGGWAVIKPSVHVAPYLRLDPKSSFSESFEITNNGYFAIYGVQKSCRGITVNGKTPSGLTIETGDNLVFDDDLTDIIQSGGSTTTACHMNRLLPIFPKVEYSKAEIEIIVNFRPSWYLWRKEQRTRFLGRLDSVGQIQWTYE